MYPLLLSSSDVKKHLRVPQLFDLVRQGFVALSESLYNPGKRVSAHLWGDNNVMVLMPGMLEGIDAYTVKVNAKFPGHSSTITGLILLNRLSSGELLAVIESSYLTALRTGVAGAIATHALSRPDARSVAVIGAGCQGLMQVACLSHKREIELVAVYDVDGKKAADLVDYLTSSLNIRAYQTASLEEAVYLADIVITATWSNEPFLHSGLLKEGAHITAIGSDQPGRSELEPALFSSSTVFCDSSELVKGMKVVDPAIQMTELGGVLSGRVPNRRARDKFTIFIGVGMPFQDLAAAWLCYTSALTDHATTSFDWRR